MNEEIPFEVDDAIVLLIGAPSQSPSLQNRIAGITRLEKLLFLFERETDLSNLFTEKPEFVAHNFGPFSPKVYQAVETLEAAGLITDSAVIAPTTEDSWESDQIIGADPSTTYTTRDFELTSRGQEYYKWLVTELLNRDQQRLLSEFKDRFGGLPLRQLVRYVYTQYPELTEKSIIREQILGR